MNTAVRLSIERNEADFVSQMRSINENIFLIKMLVCQRFAYIHRNGLIWSIELINQKINSLHKSQQQN